MKERDDLSINGNQTAKEFVIFQKITDGDSQTAAILCLANAIRGLYTVLDKCVSDWHGELKIGITDRTERVDSSLDV